MNAIPNLPSKAYVLVTLGLLTAFGPYITDLYLSSLPAQADYFATAPSMVQLGLTTSMAGLALGQLVIGPLSDQYGRRKPLLAFLAAFTLVTLVSILSPNIVTFLVLRFLQGFAGASGIVLSRSVAADLFAGKELVSAMGTMGAVNGIAPVTAPVIGALLAEVTDWRGIFALLAALGVILTAAALRIPETLPKERRTSRGAETFKSLLTVFSDKGFRLVIAQQWFGFALLFGYIASSPFIFQRVYGLGGIGFSICFAVNAIGIGLGAGSSVKLSTSPAKTLFSGACGMVAFALLSAAVLCTGSPLSMLEPCYFLMLVSLGFTFPTAASICMSRQRRKAGAASAVLGASGFIAGGIVSPLAGLGGAPAEAASFVFIASALISLFFAFLAKRYLEAHPEENHEGEPLEI